MTISAADGVVLAESHADRTEMDNHLLRPEVQQALNTGHGNSMRHSDTLGYEMMYTAVPVGGGAANDEAGPGRDAVALPLGDIRGQYQPATQQSIVLVGLRAAPLAGLCWRCSSPGAPPSRYNS